MSQPDGPNSDAEHRIVDLERQLDRVNADLSAARARIVELEAARDRTLDRIAWVIDSLHNGLEK